MEWHETSIFHIHHEEETAGQCAWCSAVLIDRAEHPGPGVLHSEDTVTVSYTLTVE